jgi:hypothetical protein
MVGNKVVLQATAALLLFAGAGDGLSQPARDADILIKGGQVVDGTGGPWMRADVAIKGDRIVYVGRAPVTATRVIDASGKMVTPGFIDMHTHSEFGLAFDGRGLSKITQGVTTEVLGEHLSAGPVLGPAVDDPIWWRRRSSAAGPPWVDFSPSCRRRASAPMSCPMSALARSARR